MQKNIAIGVRFRRLAAALLGVAVFATGIATGFSTAAQNSEPPLAGDFGGNFTLFEPPIPAPPTAFSDASEGRTTLRDFKGEVVLVNFWATWCAPCVAEMPALNRLQAELAPQGFRIVAISQDRRGLDIVKPFYEKLDLDAMGIYLDPKGTASRQFEVRGLPTSLLVDRRNRIIGILQGPAEWDSPEAKALMQFYLDQPMPASSG
ncbi:TlpA disulfide reductase family protein [Pelagibius sp. Alg239-R121]|uniref:TlpA disulfide reductase family protein n=1 Tax=Pelagibius sp. Alg239-R121 TaxID=2993448 RepID=UPI0024A7860B|nr:TlpA disulfide reductase family protein [Pelagibius sp. Alg239-R121]